MSEVRLKMRSLSGMLAVESGKEVYRDKNHKACGLTNLCSRGGGGGGGGGRGGARNKGPFIASNK